MAGSENPTDHQKAIPNAAGRLPPCPVTALSRMTARTAVPNDPAICCVVRVSTLEWAICCPAEFASAAAGVSSVAPVISGP